MTIKTILSSRSAALFSAAIALVVMTVGCGDTGSRLLEYDNQADEVSGKINLDRVTYITPRLKVGVDEVRLNAKNIRKLLGKAKNGDYTSFRVTAYILFDEYKVTLFESELFEKGKNEPDSRTLRTIKKKLNSALAYYQSI